MVLAVSGGRLCMHASRGVGFRFVWSIVHRDCQLHQNKSASPKNTLTNPLGEPISGFMLSFFREFLRAIFERFDAGTGPTKK